MLAQCGRCVTLFVLDAGDTREARQGVEGLTCYFASDVDAACLCMWVAQCLVDTINRANTGINIGEFGDPLVSRFDLENAAQDIHGLVTLTRPDWCVEG